MSTMGAFFQSAIGPLVKRGLSAVGVGVVSFVGVEAALQGAMTAAKSAFGGMTGEVLQIAAMFGFFTAIGIIAGGLSAGLSMMVLKRFAKLT